jgi:hypothetical protein
MSYADFHPQVAAMHMNDQHVAYKAIASLP